MDFSSLVLMEKDKNNYLVKEVGSYKVTEGAKYITKMYKDNEDVFVYFDTYSDVEDWEYTAIFDLFNRDIFFKNGFKIEDVDDEFNPTFLVKFSFIEKHELFEEKICRLCDLIESEMQSTFEKIKGKENEYKSLN